MLNAPFYNSHLKNVVTVFGRMFSDIVIIRENSKNSAKNQTIRIPVSYAPREKWLVRIDQDPELENNVYTVLPVMSFDIQGVTYDSTRKLNKMNKMLTKSGTNATVVHSPVPYNVDISLYIVTKTQEDNLQILEQILPAFTPDYTVKYSVTPNIVEDLPVILNNVMINDEYEGDFKTRRFVTTTVSFTCKVNLYSGSTTRKLIDNAVINLGELPDTTDAVYSDGVWTERF